MEHLLYQHQIFLIVHSLIFHWWQGISNVLATAFCMTFYLSRHDLHAILKDGIIFYSSRQNTEEFYTDIKSNKSCQGETEIVLIICDKNV